MKHLIEKTVCSGFRAACRFATCPTNLSPVLVNATTDGVMRPPSLLTITVGLSPSMVATAELVVPRSIPIAFAMTFYSFAPGSFARRCAVVALPCRKQFPVHPSYDQVGEPSSIPEGLARKVVGLSHIKRQEPRPASPTSAVAH